MRKLMIIIAAMLSLAACSRQETKVPVYCWEGYSCADTLRAHLTKYKAHGVTGACVGVGFDVAKADSAAKIAKELGMTFHAWVGIMTQNPHEEGLDSTMFTVNRKGESAYDKPAYVPYYTTLDPRNPKVMKFLIKKLEAIAEIPEVDFIQLDYIRYADVILARGLWDKYGLNMEKEYPNADYCYCDSCVAQFKAETGIDIRATEQPDTVKAWAQWRCDNVTALVNNICDAIHAKGKKVSADVFPGPYSYASWMVRQEWNKWNVDELFPMNYNDFYMEPATWVGKVTEEEVKSVAGKGKAVYSGIFICHDWKNKDKVIDPEASGLVPSEIEDAVRSSMKAGARGICLFTASGMTQEHWDALNKAVKAVKK